MSNSNGTNPSAIAVAAGIGTLEGLVSSLLAEARAETVQLGVSDTPSREMVLEHWPVPGCKRLLAHRTGNGFDSLAVPTTGVLALPPNEARLGSRFVNSGTNAIVLYLANAQRPGVPAVWLAASGGVWDGRFGELPWAGNVFAVALVGASTLVGGEL